MYHKVSEIARRIRELREISDYSPEDMARECEVATEEYLAYETGVADIPISFLLRLAERFHVDMTEMITGESPRLSTYCLTRADKGVQIERRQHYHYRNLAYNFVHRKVEPLYVIVPKGINPDLIPSAHDGHEFDYVLEGTLRVHIDGKALTLGPGDSVYYDSRHPHALEAYGDQDVRMLAVVIP
ncbi:MAG: XRE family transcriptional regulator [Oscillospiraceae bacterium]|jgi:mannose-6-phosphate isomerase-like protein (cupin superfamily)|nr:XRE family transcriptional regulator [Oscillospiraceae bacterium]